MMAPGTSSMLRARRRDVNVKPNRRLDRKSSRGMLYENEELRLRTININAEVERGQNDIKKLRRENEQLRREIWGLREEYDRLEGLLGKAKRHGHLNDDSDNTEECADEDEEYDEEGEEDEDENVCQGEHSADHDNAENQQKASSTSIKSPDHSRRNSLKVEFDGLSIVDEETETSHDVTPEDIPKVGAQFFGSIKDGSVISAVLSNRNHVGATCLNSQSIRLNSEKQFFGKIKLPNGREGVFMSDAALRTSNTSSELPMYNTNNIKAGSYNPVGFGPPDYNVMYGNVWDDLAVTPNLVQTRCAIFPESKSHYNYTFTPAESTVLSNSNTPQKFVFASVFRQNEEKCMQDGVLPQEIRASDDGYFGMGENIMNSPSEEYFHARGGPDFFISGAYPFPKSSNTFPTGGNLDELLKEINRKECEENAAALHTEVPTVRSATNEENHILPKIETENVHEVIDALESQIDTDVKDVVRGVRVLDGNCYVCVAKEDNMDALLSSGLSLRGANIKLDDVSRKSLTLALSGVPHDVTDSEVSRILANYGTVIGDIERKLYKGVDTGERVVRLKYVEANLQNIPESIKFGGTRVPIRILKSIGNTTFGNDDTREKTGILEVPDNALSNDRYRTQLNVQLKQPNFKTNRSLDNISETSIIRKQHNSSLPIIETESMRQTPVQLLSEELISSPDTNPVCKQLLGFENMENMSPKLDEPSGKSRAPTEAEKTKQIGQQTVLNGGIKIPLFESTLEDNMTLNVPLIKQNLNSNTISQTPNIYLIRGELKHNLRNEIHSTTDDSLDSIDNNLQNSVQYKNNPFTGNFLTCSNLSQMPFSQNSVNPFISQANDCRDKLVPEIMSQYQNFSHLPQFNNSSITSDGQRSLFFTQPVGSTGESSPCPLTHITQPPNNESVPGSFADVPPTAAIFSHNQTTTNTAPAPNLLNTVSSDQKGYFKITPVITHPSLTNSTKMPENMPSQSNINVQFLKEENITSAPPSPTVARKQKTQRKTGILMHQHSKSSGDEGSSKPASSPNLSKRKVSRKVSSTTSISSHHNVENSVNESSTGSAAGPNATSSPNTKHKSSGTQNRKTSGGTAGIGDSTVRGNVNNMDVSRSSSSGQDSPTKPDRRRRVSIYFNNKKGVGKRRDSVFVPNGNSGILARNISLQHSQKYGGGSTTDITSGHCAGAETTTTCSERERTNSASSRTSSATGGKMRKHSVCSNRAGSSNDIKVPWCGCWGNGCI